MRSVLVDRHVVDVGDLPPTPRPNELTGGVEDEDRRIRPPVADVDEPSGVDDEIADEAEGLFSGRLAPAPLHAVPPVAERDDEMFFGHSSHLR